MCITEKMQSNQIVLIIIILFISDFGQNKPAEAQKSNITTGSSLTPATNFSSWLSNSGLFAFGFYKQDKGFALGIFIAGTAQKTIVWTANSDAEPVSQNSTLLFTNDGRLLLQSSAQNQGYNIGDPLKPAAYASMLDSGNFVLYNSSGGIVWQSFDNPTDTLLPSQRLLPGKELVSSVSETDKSAGIFRLKMQQDGNLVQYPVNTPDTAPYSYYTSWTDGSGPGMSLNLDADGRLFLLNATGFSVKNITSGGNSTAGINYIMRIDSDGIFRLYAYNRENFSIEWWSSGDGCDPKGICGVNAFCFSNQQRAVCVCLPRFISVEEGNRTAGCRRDFIASGCGNNKSLSYTIQELHNTTWEYAPYSVVVTPEKEDCEKSCLEDCDCEAAFFIPEGRCGKHKLPLRFGREQPDPRIALIKVSMATSKDSNSSDGFLPKAGKENLRMDILIIGVSLAVFGLIMLMISMVGLLKNCIWKTERISNNGVVEFSEDLGPRSFKYAEVEIMTEGFKEEIGRGSFGTVYKGVTLDGSKKLVAVKRLENVQCEGEKEFKNEMKAIGKTHHRNLVRLLGFCHEVPNSLLVYEFMSNGSLVDVLFAPENIPTWEKRMQIASNIARGILYLHEECVDQIIHCDIKPQNILMDENGCAKISDFGLAKLLRPDQSTTFTGIRGTRGYVAPEWHRKIPITVKADVYSFGIVLLEIIFCRKGVDWKLPEKEAILDEWVCHYFENGELEKLIGDEEVDMQHFERMIKVALWCIQDEPSLRPSMRMVLHMMDGLVDVPIPPTLINSFVVAV